MATRQANIEMLVRAAMGLGDLCRDVAFLGGAATGLLLTDPAAPEVRPTRDVDVIVEVHRLSDYYGLEEKLRARGFRNDTSADAPLCRWVLGDLILDVMPTDPTILGFANRWYPDALRQAQACQLAPGLTIRLVTAPYFLATKLEAFTNRGQKDYLGSHDLEDIIAVVDGRPQLVDEVASAAEPLRRFIGREISKLLEEPDFRYVVPGHLAPDRVSQQRAPLILTRLKALASEGNRNGP